MKKYDTLVVGPISLDINIDYQDNVEREVGGAVVQSGWAAASSGAKTAIFTKLNSKDASIEQVFEGSGADLFCKESANTTSIRNQYFTADKERRACNALGQCDAFRFDERRADPRCQQEGCGRGRRAVPAAHGHARRHHAVLRLRG